MNTHESKLDRMLEKLGEMQITLARHEVYHQTNTSSLVEHVKRTNQLQEEINVFRAKIHQMELESAAKLAILNLESAKKESFIAGNWKAITVISVIVVGLVKLARDLGLL